MSWQFDPENKISNAPSNFEYNFNADFNLLGLNQTSAPVATATTAPVTTTSSSPSSYRHYAATSASASTTISATGSTTSNTTTSTTTTTTTTQNQQPPQPMLLQDTTHTPKTRGSMGILLVGLSVQEPTSCLLVAAAITCAMAQQHQQPFTWRGPFGQERNINPSHTHTLTSTTASLPSHIKHHFATADMTAMGGWDIHLHAAKLGDALLDAPKGTPHWIDYDLLRQIKEDLNKIKIFPGYNNTNTTTTNKTAQQALQCLRADIRYFKWRHGLVGHTSVIWNLQNDTPQQQQQVTLNYKTAQDLIQAVELDHEQTLPPCLIYALAALLEHCSFLNAPDFLLKCQGYREAVQQNVGVYSLGTTFATNFIERGVTDTMELMGLRVEQTPSNKYPTIQNKMTSTHEITAHGFLEQPYTILTTHLTSTDILQVPLMMDAAIYCDFFSSRSWPHAKVTQALSFLFEHNTSTTTSTTSLSSQLQTLQTELILAANNNHTSTINPTDKKKKRVRIRPDEATTTTEWAIPHDHARIICAGLACVDMQLHQATRGTEESIETFAGMTLIAGGSVSMACQTLARLSHGAPLDDGYYMQITPPVVQSVIPICNIGKDEMGHTLVNLLEHCGSASRNVDTKIIREYARDHSTARTALAVLPIYKDGRRGCFFDAASNDTFSPNDLITLIRNLTKNNMSGKNNNNDDDDSTHHPSYGAFLFGYPHLLPLLHGKALAQVFLEARSVMLDGGIIVMDLNGVPPPQRHCSDLLQDNVIGAALEHVDILHMNEEELQLLTGCKLKGDDEDESIISNAVNLFLECNVGIVLVTRGRQGSFVRCNNEARFAKSEMLPRSWADCTAMINAVELPRDAIINTNGAGDSFTAGFLVAAMLRHTGLTMLTSTPNNNNISKNHASAFSDDDLDLLPRSPPIKIVTPYQLYMRENYMSLKKQCNDDKKGIFSKCHELWENETEEVKLLYDQRAADENEENDNAMVRSLSLSQNHSIDAGITGDENTNLYMANRSLTLESAVQFASLVAAHHIDTKTRSLNHIDVTRLLERSMIFPDGLEEI